MEGLIYCSVPKFKMVFVNKFVEYTYQDATGGSSLALMSSGDVLLKIKETSSAAVVIYDHLQLGKKWNLPGKHMNNAVIVPKCDNCGDPNHLSPKCPKSWDEEKCKKAWEAWAKAQDSEGGRGGQGRGGQGGRGGGAGRGSGSGGQHAPWDSTAKSNNSGVMMINGAWKMLCNLGCGWNESHTTKHHDEHQQSAATFKVPPHHPYWLLLGKPNTAAAIAAGVLSPSVAGATQIPTSESVLASLTGVIDRLVTNVKSAEMSSFLGELCNVLGN